MHHLAQMIFNFFGDALLLTIHFLVYFDCPCLLRWSNNVPSATNLARYPNLHSFGLSHDYGLQHTILISNQTPPFLGLHVNRTGLEPAHIMDVINSKLL